MGVQFAAELDPAAEAERLVQWAASYRASGGTGRWLGPRREAGEQWLAVIRGVSRDEIDQAQLADPARLIAHRRAPKLIPHAWLSPQRVIIGQGRQVVEAWPLADLYDLRLLDDLTGVVLLAAEPGGDDRFPALLSTVVPWFSKWGGRPPPGYGLRRVDLDWLKVEAAFADQRGRLDEWTQELPSRLADLVRRAQDVPVQ
jgi:hypothetical protein